MNGGDIRSRTLRFYRVRSHTYARIRRLTDLKPYPDRNRRYAYEIPINSHMCSYYVGEYGRGRECEGPMEIDAEVSSLA